MDAIDAPTSSKPVLFLQETAPPAGQNDPSSPVSRGAYENTIEKQNAVYGLSAAGSEVDFSGFDAQGNSTPTSPNDASFFAGISDTNPYRPTRQQQPWASNAGGMPALQAGSNVHFRHGPSRLWQAFNVLTFVIACTALVVAVVKPGASSGPSVVAASAVTGLSSWQQQSEGNITSIQRMMSQSVTNVTDLQTDVASALQRKCFCRTENKLLTVCLSFKCACKLEVKDYCKPFWCRFHHCYRGTRCHVQSASL